jgi:hypothetical protein
MECLEWTLKKTSKLYVFTAMDNSVELAINCTESKPIASVMVKFQA